VSSPQTEHPGGGARAASISNLVVHLMSEYTGRGPTKARTYINADLVSVVLWDTLTKGERSLVRDGEEQRVLDMRKAFQSTMRAEMVSGIEQITGRSVLAFFSDNHVDPDMAVEVFFLEPAGDELDGAR
jgi:uncharacterized protein YbcI